LNFFKEKGGFQILLYDKKKIFLMREKRDGYKIIFKTKITLGFGQ